MRAADIMTRRLVTAAPDTAVSAIAKLMLANRIGAVPVIDDQSHVVGIISEYDLLKRPPADSPRAWWLRLFKDDVACLEEIASARDLKARDVMVRRVTMVSDTAPISVVASMMARHRLRHMPVLHDGKIVGIISRGDLLDGFVRQYREEAPAPAPSD